MVGKAFNYRITGQKALPPYGEDVEIPFADPLWYQGYVSPYFSEKHVQWRDACRKFVQDEIAPYIEEWEKKGGYPSDLFAKLAKAGFFSCSFPAEYGGTCMFGK